MAVRSQEHGTKWISASITSRVSFLWRWSFLTSPGCPSLLRGVHSKTSIRCLKQDRTPSSTMFYRPHWASITHYVCNFCSLRYKNKTSLHYPPPHTQSHWGFILTVDLSNTECNIFSLLSWEFPSHSPMGSILWKGLSLTHLNCQHHYFCALGTLLNKIRRWQQLEYQYCRIW